MATTQRCLNSSRNGVLAHPLSDARFLVMFLTDLRGNPETEIYIRASAGEKRERRREPQKWVGEEQSIALASRVSALRLRDSML